MKNIKELVKNLLELQREYANTIRGIIPYERYTDIVEGKLLKSLELDNKVLREPLIEHVGHLPIIASYLYPHIENTKKINLGKVLVMLSIHDIGETKVGDVFALKKTPKQANEECIVAKEILHKHFHKYFDEMESLKTIDAKFAKAVDAIAPILHEIDLPIVTKKRYKHFGFTAKDVEEKRRKYFLWDKIFLGIFDYCIKQYP